MSRYFLRVKGNSVVILSKNIKCNRKGKYLTQVYTERVVSLDFIKYKEISLIK